MIKIKPAVNWQRVLGLLTVMLSMSLGQPATPSGEEYPCHANPTSTTIDEPMDCEGFQSIFNGENFDGWWQSCQTSHSSPDPGKGGIWKIGTEEKAIYSQQRANGAGGILMTNKIYKNYDLVIEFWPDFGNDAGIFNRTNPQGICQQVVLDYINGSSVGGHWSEAGWSGTPTWLPPFKMGANEQTITERDSWSFKGAWSDAWDPNNWNNLKVQTFGFPPTLNTWMKKITSDEWIPVVENKVFGNEVNGEPKEGYIGLQVHQGSGRWGGRKGNWYRVIKVRELDDDGNITANPPAPIISQQPTIVGKVEAGAKIDLVVEVAEGPNPKCADLLKYQWKKDGEPVEGATQATYSIAALSANETGKYTVEISNPVGTNKAVSEPVDLGLTPVGPYEVNVPGIQMVLDKAIKGNVDENYHIQVRDVLGNVVSGFSGTAGAIFHTLPEHLSGILFVQIRTASYTKNWKVYLQ